ncbi:hypothetical protein N9N32_00145 [Alphaproteobacteria bacterium]|nr:hypothetical protein [Alphaproteobacteria bacterium]
MAIKTKYKMPKEGNQIKVTYSNGKTKVERSIYAVLDKSGEINKEATEARIEYVGSTLDLGVVAEEVIETPVEEVTIEEVVEEVMEEDKVILEALAEEEEVCCDDVCEDCPE